MKPTDDESLVAQKRAAARAAVQLVRDGMCVGLGTGTTASLFVETLGQAAGPGLRVRCVATSPRTQALAQACGLPLVALNDLFAEKAGTAQPLDLAIDGADQVDPQLNLIKGAGGALLREKIVARASRELVIAADSSKIVSQLGSIALPVEVVPFGWSAVAAELRDSCGPGKLRRDAAGKPWISPDGNYILDFQIGPIADPRALGLRIDSVAGVVEHGLFCGMAKRALIGQCDGVEVLTARPAEQKAGRGATPGKR